MGKMISHLASNQGISTTSLNDCDVCIDFSHADCLFDHLKLAAKHQKALVIGTTGWNSRLDEVLAFVKEHQMGVLASPNFSIGVHLFTKILENAAKMVSPFQEYEVAGVELHHSKKVDAPSGTALALSQTIDSHFLREKKCAFSSVRVGSVPGEHTLFFDSPFDTITITHTARNREGFAQGALFAARFLMGKKGFYTFKDCMREQP